MIVIAILAIIDYNDDIVNFITESGIPLAIDPEILLLLLHFVNCRLCLCLSETVSWSYYEGLMKEDETLDPKAKIIVVTADARKKLVML